MKLFTLPSVCCIVLLMMMNRPCLAQINTGAASAVTAADVSLGGSTFNWNTPGGALSAGGGTASAQALLTAFTGTTDYLQLTGFGFAIPTGSTIDGITVMVTKQASGLNISIGPITLTGSVTDNIVQLVGPGVTSTNKASGTNWLTSPSTATYGSSSDGWGSTVWTTAMVNSPAFGVALSANMNGSTLLGFNLIPGAAVDWVTINVTYSLPTTLPVQLQQWTATRQGDVNVLYWETAADGVSANGGSANGAPAEYPADFVVQRSPDGTNWVDLATLAASPAQAAYHYTDPEPYADGPSYYRLRLHGEGQADTWSSVQVLTAKAVKRPVINMYPNPFQNTINISAPGAFTQVSLRNIQGTTLWVKVYPGGVNSTQVPAAGLPQGLYFVTIDGATYKLFKN